MMSRPLLSAPRKYSFCHVGPIATPSGATTSVGFPSISIWPERLFDSGPRPAMFSQTGAATAMSTSTTNRTPNASATLLRRRRRTATRHGPAPDRALALSRLLEGGRPLEREAGGRRFGGHVSPPHTRGEGARAPSPACAVGYLRQKLE